MIPHSKVRREGTGLSMGGHQSAQALAQPWVQMAMGWAACPW